MSDPMSTYVNPATRTTAYRSFAKYPRHITDQIYNPCLVATHDHSTGLDNSLKAWHIRQTADGRPTRCPGTSSTQRLLATAAHIPEAEGRKKAVRELKKHMNQRRAGVPIDQVTSTDAWPSNEDLNTGAGFELRYDGTISLQPFMDRSVSLPKLSTPRMRVTHQPLEPYKPYDPYKAPTPPEKQWLPPIYTTADWVRFTTPTGKRGCEFPSELTTIMKPKKRFIYSHDIMS